MKISKNIDEMSGLMPSLFKKRKNIPRSLPASFLYVPGNWTGSVLQKGWNHHT
jgi:hypothetical protein